MGVFFKTQSIRPPVKTAIKEALLTPPDGAAEADQKAAAKASDVADQVTSLEPRWPVFVAAAALLIALLVLSIYVATQADAQPKDVTSSQLKSLSTTLTSAFTSLLGGIVGVLTGEAIGKKT